MSVWGRVSGIIRVDGTPTFGKAPDIGQTVGFFSREEAYEAAEKDKTPLGSEGSIEWFFTLNDEAAAIMFGTYVITGDLRDFESPEPVRERLEETVIPRIYTANLMIRNLCIQVDMEHGESEVIYSAGFAEEDSSMKPILQSVRYKNCSFHYLLEKILNEPNNKGVKL